MKTTGNRLALLREEGGTRSVTGGACGSFGFIKLTIAACSLRLAYARPFSPKGKVRGFCENHRQPPCPPPRGGWHAKRDGRSLREFWLYQTDDCRLLPPPPNGGPPPSRRGRLWAAGCRPYNVCLSPLFPKRELPFSSKPNKCLTNTKRCSIIRGRSEKKGRKWRWMRPFNENWRY